MTCWKCGLPLCRFRLCNSAGGSHFFRFPHGATPWSDSFTDLIEFRMASQVYISLRWLNLQLIRTELLRTIYTFKRSGSHLFSFSIAPFVHHDDLEIEVRFNSTTPSHSHWDNISFPVQGEGETRGHGLLHHAGGPGALGEPWIGKW